MKFLQIKNTIISLLTILIFNNELSSQIQIPISDNLILNSSFELKKEFMDYPTEDAQSDNLLYWESRTSDTVNTENDKLLFHSPDWRYNIGTTSSAHSGRGHIGMYQYELIQQDLEQSPFLANRNYRLSFYYKASNEANLNWTNSQISFYIAKTKLRYANEGAFSWQNQNYNTLCKESYRKQPVINDIESKKIKIYSQPIRPDIGNVGEWTKVSVIISMPNYSCDLEGNLCGYNWFAIQLENEFEQNDEEGVFWNCEDGYVYLDDISITDATGCEFECRESLPNIESSIISGGICGGGDINGEGSWWEELWDWNDDGWPNVAWSASLKNAIGYELLIFPRWDLSGSPLYVQTGYDINGIKDIGYDDYYIVLRGDEMSLISMQVYAVVLFAWNCEHVARYDYLLTYVSPTTLSVKPPLINNFEPNCCPDYKYIQNTIYTSPKIEKAGISIRAGFNVNPNTSFANGNVNFYPNTGSSSPEVTYIAPNIYLESGFYSGFNFHALIGECYPYAERMSPYNREKFIGDFNQRIENESISIFPNPIRNGNDINFTQEVLQVEIFSFSGSLVYDGGNMKQIKSISLLPGMYLIRFQSKNGQWFTSKLSVL